MTSRHLHMFLARPRVDGFRRAAVGRSREASPSQPWRSAASDSDVTLRLASPLDEGSLARLAALDSSRTPAQPVLLALVGGELLVALSLTDGTHVADPFHRTAELVELLHAQARQLEGDSRMMRRSSRSRSNGRASRSGLARMAWENHGAPAIVKIASGSHRCEPRDSPWMRHARDCRATTSTCSGGHGNPLTKSPTSSDEIRPVRSAQVGQLAELAQARDRRADRPRRNRISPVEDLDAEAPRHPVFS